MQRVLRENPNQMSLYQFFFPLYLISEIVFLVLGFWFMPKWWCPLAIWGLSILVAFIPIPDRIGALIGIVASPVFIVLAYLSLFGLI